MPISLHNYVDVNFKAERMSTLTGSYGTSVLISKEATSPDKTYESFNDFVVDYSSTSTEIYKSAKIYFENGGIALRVVKRESEETIVQVLDKIKDSDFIMFACSDTIIDSEVVAVGNYLEAKKAPDKKIFVATDTNTNAKSSESDDSLSSKVNLLNYIVLKYSSDKNAGMSTMAYFSKFDLNGTNTINDYHCTPELLPIEDITELELETLRKRNYNVHVQVGKNYKFNDGGNMSNGVAIEERWSLIAIEKDIAEAMMNWLLTKPTLQDSNLVELKSRINSVLSRYTTNGLLRPNNIYNGKNESVIKNNKKFDLIQNGQILPTGYITFVLPIISLTYDERANHQAPKVYVYVSIAGGIRKVSVEGVVI